MKRFIKKQHEPRTISIQGEDYPVFFSLAALEAVEADTDMPFSVFSDKLVNGKATAREQATFLKACLNAGGTEVTTDELLESLGVNEFAAVLQQLSAVLTEQMPEAEENEAKKQ